jgi:DNA polymerase
MNPTGRNISSSSDWEGLRAPWIGTKQVWDIFKELNLIDQNIYNKIKELKALEWGINFASEVYKNIQSNSIYITNLAKCTQLDARPLPNLVFKDYLELMIKEIEIVNPNFIISFGNQVSSILLGKSISVSNYINKEFEELKLSKSFNIYPTYYPVGQGRRNMPLTIKRIKSILE